MNDDNYNYINCPYCKEPIHKRPSLESRWVEDLEDEESDFFQCAQCENFFYAQLEIHKEYEYIVRELTKKEIKENNFSSNKEIIEDVPGQTFMWDNS